MSPARAMALFLALALATVPALGSIAPEGYADKLLSGTPQLSEEQAQQIEGLWELTGDRRLEGHWYDEALQNQTTDGSSPEEVHKSASASYEERGLTAWAWLPYVNATDGFFAGQYILKKGEEMSVVRRLVGMATADAEGDAITASAAVNQDTGMLTVRVRGDRMVWVFLEALEVHGSSPAGGSVTSATSGSTAVMAATGKVLDDHMQAYFLFDKVPAGEQEDVATQAVEFLRQHPEGVLPAPKQ